MAEYPAELEQTAVLMDGREVFIRPIRPTDAPALLQAIEDADEETLYSRFLGAAPHDNASIRHLVEVDYQHRLALVAFAPDGSGAGIARYEGSPGSDRAEVAIAVDPGWRKVGLGSRLLRALGNAAVERGVRQFTALALAENVPAIATLRASGLKFSQQISSGTVELLMDLAPRS